MAIQFYSPNKKNTGAAAFLSSNSKDGAMYVKFVKQNGWNEKTQNGIFAGGSILNVKFNIFEIGEMLHAITTQGNWSFYHKVKDSVTSGAFKYYEMAITKKDGSPGTKVGFTFWAKSGENDYKVGLTMGAVRAFAAYLSFVLDRVFQADYAADKKRYEDAMKQKQESEKKSLPKKNVKSEYIEEEPPQEELVEETEQAEEF